MSKPQFFEIKDATIIGKILDVAHRHRPTLTVWSRNQSLRFDTQIASFVPVAKRLGLMFPASITDLDFLEAIEKQGSKDLMASFQIETVNFFMKTQFQELTKNHMILVHIPQQIFKMQRRSHLRIPFTRSTAPKLLIVDPRKENTIGSTIKPSDLLQFRVLDLSVGGLAVAARIDELPLFNVGAKFRNISFKLKGLEIMVDGVIMHALETFNDQKKAILQVGIQFVNLPPRYERIIAQFALEESRRLFTLLY